MAHAKRTAFAYGMKQLNTFIVALVYIVLSMLIGEVHPFTQVPMYSNIPGWAYSFYLSNGQNTLLPLNHYFKLPDDELSHQYSAFCQSRHIAYGNQTETPEQLQTVGKLMLQQITLYQYAPLPAGKIGLHRVCYFLQHDTIAQQDIVMYAKP